MVRTRVTVGVVLSAVFVVLLALDSLLAGGPVFYGVVGLLVAASLHEFGALAERGGHRPRTLAAVVLAVVLVIVQHLVLTGRWALLRGEAEGGLAVFYAFAGLAAAIAFLLLAVDHLLWRPPERYLSDLAVTVLGFLYAWFLGAHVLALRSWGTACVVACLAATKLGDVAAYFTGTFCGRHKLAPRLSPKKTIEGALGGTVGSVVSSVLAALVLLPPPLAVGFWCAFGLAVGLAAQVGDLVESGVKRSVGAKDSNTLLPTFGGVLDVVDSVLFGAPVALWLLELWGRHVLPPPIP
jgi:phosphatidate cytidylyltransferase